MMAALPRWAWWAGAVAACVVAVQSSVPRAGVVPAAVGRARVVAAAKQAGLSDAWTNWLVWVARGESGWSSAANNDSASESARADDAYVRLASEGRYRCAGPANVRGSGGWYGQLWPYTAVYLGELGVPMAAACDVHAAWRDPVRSTLAHLRQVRGTITTLRKLPPGLQTFLHLRALYGLPSRVNAPHAIDNPTRRTGYGNTLRSAGISPTFLDVAVPPRSTLDAAIATLAEIAGGVQAPEVEL